MSPDGVAIDSMPVDAIRRDLAAWYARHRRTLPWRADAGAAGDGASPVLHPDPYAVWISEVMLQQTQVATATPYFQRWMARFPRVADLAAADLDAVLGFWQGLGYYARARNLHRAARAIMTVHGGRLPDDVEALRRLPGIGAYTAGAIASIAFGLREPAVDGNARRVLARLGAIAGDPARGAAAAAIHALARRLADDPAPGDVNQALMELGATVCVPRTPRCGGCPVAGHCRAFATGRGAAFPMAATRSGPRIEHVLAFALRRAGGDAGDRWLVARRPARGLLGGLWEFPLVIAAPGADPAAACQAAIGLAPAAPATGPSVTHVFTHIRLTATVVVGVVAGGGGDGVRGDVAQADGDGSRREAATDRINGNGVDDGILADAHHRPRLAAAYVDWRWVRWSDLGADTLPTSTLMDKLVAAAAGAGAVKRRGASPRAG